MKNFYDDEKSNLREKVLSTEKPSRVHEDFLKYAGETFPNKRILDIGTGNGYVLHEIERKYPKKYMLYGTDISQKILNKAKKLIGTKARLYLADNNQLPFKEGFFTTVTAKNVTNFSSTELARVLEDRGLFVFREYGEGKGLIEIANCFKDRLVRARKPEFYVTQLNQAGFENIKLQRYWITRGYSLGNLIEIVQIFPFIKDLSESDIKRIEEFFGRQGKIIIASDPFVLTAMRKKR